MTSKTELINNIREWISVDNEVRELNKEIRQRKQKQQKISQALMQIMKESEIDAFDVTGGKIMYNKKTIKKPLSKKNLLGILSKYYKNDETQAIEMNNFIMNNRDEVVKESIIRKMN
jgi:hypothetical protein